MSTSNPNSKSRAILPSLPVILVFVVVTVMAWLIPLRPTMSETENRNLEKFPEFTVTALLEGSYFDDIGVWFSDTFTFRETWIDTATSLERLYGSRSVAIYGEIGESDEIPDITVSTESDEQLQAPETSAPVDETQSTGEETEPTDETKEDYDPRNESVEETAPKDATQSSWGGQRIDEGEYVGASTLIQIGDSAYVFTGFNQYYSDLYAENMNRAAEVLDGKARLFTILGLENTTFMLTREDRISMGCKPEEDAVEYIYSNIDSRVHTVSIFDNMVAHNSEYLAFRTDYHWTATGAYYAYEAWCEEAGFEPVPLSEYEVMEFPGFLGSCYANALQSHLLEEDTVVAYVPPGNVKLYLSDISGDSMGWEQPLITDLSHASANSKYLTFLAGDHARGLFINDDITDGSSCLVIKTSVGNPFVYFLTQHYQYVYILDIRYYFGRDLASYVDYYRIDDVIFMHGAGLAMSPGGNNLIADFVK